MKIFSLRKFTENELKNTLYLFYFVQFENVYLYSVNGDECLWEWSDFCLSLLCVMLFSYSENKSSLPNYIIYLFSKIILLFVLHFYLFWGWLLWLLSRFKTKKKILSLSFFYKVGWLCSFFQLIRSVRFVVFCSSPIPAESASSISIILH